MNKKTGTKKELNNKEISLNEYKEEIKILNYRHKQEIQKVKKELEESNIKDKNEVLGKIDELIKLIK